MEIELELPHWLSHINSEMTGHTYKNIEDRAEFVIALSRLNIEHKTGGPFGAAVFDMNNTALISAGANLVVSTGYSIAHAEIVALMVAQKKLGTYYLSGSSKYQLVSSCQPCAMCMGAIPWSKIDSLVCCSRDQDARAIGFSEGDKPDDWIEKYKARNIEVINDVLRPEACKILQDYSEKQGPIY